MTRALQPVVLVGFVLAALTFPTAGAAETAPEASFI